MEKVVKESVLLFYLIVIAIAADNELCVLAIT